jgi:chromosomal replication initiation ATPase DnaA
MTFLSRVWNDALRRLRNDMPEFVFEAWIAPLEAKTAGERLLIRCPTSFHKERLLRHHLTALERGLEQALSEGVSAGSIERMDAPQLEFLTPVEFARAEGIRLEARAPMRRVGAEERARVVNAPDRSSQPAPRTPASGKVVRRLFTPAHENAPPLERMRAIPRMDGRKSEEPVSHDADVAEEGQDRRFGEHRAPSFGLDGCPPGRGRPRYTFDRFVVGPCNALAREAALALAQRRQSSLNLVYLAGPSGMGKSHLARATAEEARRQLPDGREPGGVGEDTWASSQDGTGRTRVLLTTAEQFTSEFVSAVRNGRNEAWIRQYRGRIDLLVVEDIQHLSGRTKTQQELFHTLAHVLDAGGRVLLTGDQPPRELTDLDARLRALAGRGFVAELGKPDAVVRRHLFREKAAAAGVSLPAACLELLVEATDSKSLGGSILELESLLIQVVMSASLAHRTIDADLVAEAIALKSGISAAAPPRRLSVTEIVRTVAGFFGLKAEALASRSRRRDVLIPRQLAMYLAHRYTDASFSEIGQALGRDHPSVKNAIQKIEAQTLANAALRYQVESLSERIDGLLDASTPLG